MAVPDERRLDLAQDRAEWNERGETQARKRVRPEYNKRSGDSKGLYANVLEPGSASETKTRTSQMTSLPVDVGTATSHTGGYCVLRTCTSVLHLHLHLHLPQRVVHVPGRFCSNSTETRRDGRAPWGAPGGGDLTAYLARAAALPSSTTCTLHYTVLITLVTQRSTRH